MSGLPRVSGREAVAALTKVGFRVRRQKGSHIILRRDQPFGQTVVPDHFELDRGTLRAIIRQSEPDRGAIHRLATMKAYEQPVALSR